MFILLLLSFGLILNNSFNFNNINFDNNFINNNMYSNTIKKIL